MKESMEATGGRVLAWPWAYSQRAGCLRVAAAKGDIPIDSCSALYVHSLHIHFSLF
jgi:hypothetical protein